MARRYDDSIQVKEPLPGDGADRSGEAPTGPAAFLWDGRHYVVREVLAHWYERRAWWAGDAARAVHGHPDPDGEDPDGPPDADREVWRVVAAAGRQAGTGVYDLSRTGPPSRRWSLLRVAD